MPPTLTAERLTAAERREQILRAAIGVFAEHGYEAASTEEIARRAGISQPYVFRLFGTKRELVLASIDRCYEEIAAAFTRAAGGLSGDAALTAMGDAYRQMIEADHDRVRAQLQGYAACDDPEIRELMATGFGGLWDLVRRLSGADAAEVSRFFANGMLLNVLAMMGQFTKPQRWASELIVGCASDA